jgi:hypothetical protein
VRFEAKVVSLYRPRVLDNAQRDLNLLRLRRLDVIVVLREQRVDLAADIDLGLLDVEAEIPQAVLQAVQPVAKHFLRPGNQPGMQLGLHREERGVCGRHALADDVAGVDQVLLVTRNPNVRNVLRTDLQLLHYLQAGRPRGAPVFPHSFCSLT